MFCNFSLFRTARAVWSAVTEPFDVRFDVATDMHEKLRHALEIVSIRSEQIEELEHLRDTQEMELDRLRKQVTGANRGIDTITEEVADLRRRLNEADATREIERAQHAAALAAHTNSREALADLAEETAEQISADMMEVIRRYEALMTDMHALAEMARQVQDEASLDHQPYHAGYRVLPDTEGLHVKMRDPGARASREGTAT